MKYIHTFAVVISYMSSSFLKKIYKWPAIARSRGGDIGCLLFAQDLTSILPISLWCCNSVIYSLHIAVKYNTMMHITLQRQRYDTGQSFTGRRYHIPRPDGRDMWGLLWGLLRTMTGTAPCCIGRDISTDILYCYNFVEESTVTAVSWRLQKSPHKASQKAQCCRSVSE